LILKFASEIAAKEANFGIGTPGFLNFPNGVLPGARSVTRQLFGAGLFCCLLAWLPAGAADAAEIPLRKPGLWEMKVLRAGSAMPQMTMQHCTDETTDKEMSRSFAPTAKDICAKQSFEKTATGYVADSVCDVGGMSVTSHSDITGDFNSAYTMTSTSHSQGGPAAVPRDSTTVIEAKWLRACKADQKPGDIVMPGGFKLNVRDAEKLRALTPKPPAPNSK
jgi:hypothetical protein